MGLVLCVYDDPETGDDLDGLATVHVRAPKRLRQAALVTGTRIARFAGLSAAG